MKNINYTLDGLRSLVVLQREKSFVRAARAMHITQPALTRRIQLLEGVVGSRLVERTTRSLTFTPLGNWLSEQLNADLQTLDQRMTTAVRMAQGEMGQVEFACLTTVAYAQAPALLEKFRTVYPNVRILMHDDTGQRVIESVKSGKVEFGVGIWTEDVHGLQAQILGDDPFVLAMSRQHSLASKRKIRWRDLVGTKVVALRQTSANRRHIDAVLEAHSIDPPWFDEVEHLSSLMAQIGPLQGLAVVPRLAMMTADARDLRFVPLVEPSIHRKIALFKRHGLELSHTAQMLWTLFEKSQVKPKA